MKISKKDALSWFEFFASLPEGESLTTQQEEIMYASLAQIETWVYHRHEALKEQIKGLKSLDKRSLYVGPDHLFPQGCKSCLLGDGLSAVRKTNTCNLECKFCYNYGELDDSPPIGSGMWEIGGSKLYERDLDLLLHIHKKPTGIAYVYLEPFMEIEKYYSVVKKFHQAGIHQHMYTNGTLANEETLKALGQAGLDEIRFNLGAADCHDYVIKMMKLAKKYIPRVGIETPMTPEFFQGFLDKQEQILETGLDFINCAELHLNHNNIYNYFGEPMYMARHGYISPIWSRFLTLELMKLADDNQWPLVVHDCSNDTKFARGLNATKASANWFGSSNYTSEFDDIPFDIFIPILKDPDIEFLEEEPLKEEYQMIQLGYSLE
jgi:hypothetical protein